VKPKSAFDWRKIVWLGLDRKELIDAAIKRRIEGKIRKIEFLIERLRKFCDRFLGIQHFRGFL
jgi:hypothetical protein